MTGCSCGDCELCAAMRAAGYGPEKCPPASEMDRARLQLCSLGYMDGPRPSPEAMQEIHAFAYHLRDHRKQIVEGCRFCAERSKKAASHPAEPETPSHSCPRCGAACICAEGFDGDPCQHFRIGCKSAAPAEPERGTACDRMQPSTCRFAKGHEGPCGQPVTR